jgi:hypothetical protein
MISRSASKSGFLTGSSSTHLVGARSPLTEAVRNGTLAIVETEDAIDRALEPGEKIVWSDRPHRVVAAAIRTLQREWWLLLLASPFLAFSFLTPAGPLVGPLSAAAILAIFFARRVVVRLGERYVVTSRAHLLVLSGDEVSWIELPEPGLIRARVGASDEFGDIWFGTSRVAHDVSYPLIAAETLRQVARGNRLC